MRLPVGRLRVWAEGSGGHPPELAAPVEEGLGLSTQIHSADCGSGLTLLVSREFALTDPAQESLDTAGSSPCEPASAGTSKAPGHLGHPLNFVSGVPPGSVARDPMALPTPAWRRTLHPHEACCDAVWRPPALGGPARTAGRPAGSSRLSRRIISLRRSTGSSEAIRAPS